MYKYTDYLANYGRIMQFNKNKTEPFHRWYPFVEEALSSASDNASPIFSISVILISSAIDLRLAVFSEKKVIVHRINSLDSLAVDVLFI